MKSMFLINLFWFLIVIGFHSEYKNACRRSDRFEELAKEFMKAAEKARFYSLTK